MLNLFFLKTTEYGNLLSMHEMAIVENMMGIIQEEMTRHQVSRLKTVHLVVGDLTAVVPEALNFCFEIYNKGTPLEGAKLEMDFIPLKGRCKNCGHEFEVKDMTFICPECGGKDIDVLSGRELYIKEIEAE